MSFSPDNSKVLVPINLTGIFNLYVLPVDGGEREQLTHSTTKDTDSRRRRISPSPTGRSPRFSTATCRQP